MRDLFHLCLQVVDKALHRIGVRLEVFAARVQSAFDLWHSISCFSILP